MDMSWLRGWYQQQKGVDWCEIWDKMEWGPEKSVCFSSGFLWRLLIQVKVTKEYLWWSLKFFCIGLDCTETKGSLGWLLQCPHCLCFFFLFRWSLQVLVLCLDKYRVFWKLDYAKENGCSFKPFLPRKSKCYIVIVCVLPVCLCVWWWCFFP